MSRLTPSSSNCCRSAGERRWARYDAGSSSTRSMCASSPDSEAKGGRFSAIPASECTAQRAAAAGSRRGRLPPRRPHHGPHGTVPRGAWRASRPRRARSCMCSRRVDCVECKRKSGGDPQSVVNDALPRTLDGSLHSALQSSLPRACPSRHPRSSQTLTLGRPSSPSSHPLVWFGNRSRRRRRAAPAVAGAARRASSAVQVNSTRRHLVESEGGREGGREGRS